MVRADESEADKGKAETRDSVWHGAIQPNINRYPLGGNNNCQAAALASRLLITAAEKVELVAAAPAAVASGTHLVDFEQLMLLYKSAPSSTTTNQAALI